MAEAAGPPTGVTGPGLELARRMCEAARTRAEALGAVVSVAVVDAGGHPVAFERMDRAEIAGPRLAVDKAFTAVAHRCPTGELAAEAAPGGSLAGLAANGGGRYITFAGGLPLWSPDGRVVGGVGVSGASAEQDLECAGQAARLWPFRPPTT
jgi:uncharacterized protein GlcG (DUF336 family)